MKPKKLEFARVYLEMGEGQAPAARDVWIANLLEGFTYVVRFWRGGFYWTRVVSPREVLYWDYGPCRNPESGMAACQEHWELFGDNARNRPYGGGSGSWGFPWSLIGL